MARKSNLIAPRTAPATLVQGSMDTLTQGVSQQPPHLRQPGQGQEQINGWSSPVVGLTKRRPTIFMNKLSSTPIDDFYLETMPVATGERYNIFIRRSGVDTALSIVNNGVPASIDIHGYGMSMSGKDVVGNVGSYLFIPSDLQQQYVFFNNGPLGFLLNRSRTVEMDIGLTPAVTHEGILFIQAVSYEITYTVNLDGVDIPSYTTPKATDTDNLLSVDRVASELVAKINATGNYVASHVSGVVLIRKNNGADFRLGLSDGRSNTLARSFKDGTAMFSGLPTIGPNDFQLRIENSPETPRDDYWVKFKTRDGSAFGEGSWVEAVAPGIPYKINFQTMPLLVYRAAPNVFFIGPANGAKRSLVVNGTTYTFQFPKWGERDAGDETSVPTPSFIGKAIKDHGIFRGRYVLLAGENIIISRVDEIFNFFQQTSSQVLDTDPIDLVATSETSGLLYWMLPIDESLLVFGEKSQFQVRPVSADVLTPRNALCTRLSNIEMNVHLRPKLCGANVVFSTLEYDYTGFREFQFYDSQTRRIGLNVGGNSSITSNVPKYIPGAATIWDVGDSVDFFVCMTPSMSQTLYVYKYLWAAASNQMSKLQASWSQWDFDGAVRWVRFIDNDLFLVMTYADGTYTVRIRNEELNDPYVPQIYLDRKLRYPECNQSGLTTTRITAAWDATTNVTTFTLPYQMTGTTDAVIRYDNSRGQALQVGTNFVGNQIVCQEKGDWRNEKMVFGRRYQFFYTFTQPHKPQTSQSRQSIIGDLTGRLQIATWTVHHVDTARYDVVVKRKNRAKDTYNQFWSRVLNVQSNRLDYGEQLLQSGRFRVPVYSKNTACSISIDSRSWLPVTITGATWEGSYNNRARSIG